MYKYRSGYISFCNFFCFCYAFPDLRQHMAYNITYVYLFLHAKPLENYGRKILYWVKKGENEPKQCSNMNLCIYLHYLFLC